jgi:hypothetical protein
MAVNKDRLSTVNSTPPNAHIEVVTENGFTIARVSELGLSSDDSASECRFIVSRSTGGVRSIKVQFSEVVIALVEEQCPNLSRSSSFWLNCGERHLTEYLWKNDYCPPDGLLKIDSLSTEELLMAARWD